MRRRGRMWGRGTGTTPPVHYHRTLPREWHLQAAAGWNRAPISVPRRHGRNGRGWSSPQCVKTQAAVDDHQPAVDRPHFSLESRPVSFSAEKEMDLAPAAGSRTPAGQAPPDGISPLRAGQGPAPGPSSGGRSHRAGGAFPIGARDSVHTRGAGRPRRTGGYSAAGSGRRSRRPWHPRSTCKRVP